MVSSDLKYLAIYRTLKQRLIAQTYAVGDLFPAEPELQKEFGASRITVRRSVQMLVDDGFLRKMPGVGTVVLSTKGSLQLARLVSFSQENQHKAINSEIVSASSAYEPQPAILFHLELPAGSHVAYQERTRYIDGELIGYQKVYVPDFIELEEQVLKDPAVSLYEEFKRKGHQVAEADESIAAVIADKHTARLLNVSKGTPLLYVQRTTRDDNNRPIEFAEIYYRGDSYQYTTHLKAAE